MKLTFNKDAQQRLARYLGPNKKMILDFDDGVGPFSAVGDCGLEASYKLVFVDAERKLPDFDSKMTSNLGDIYFKGYTRPQFDDEMEVRFNSRYFTMPLVSPHGTLTENIELLDLGNAEVTNKYSQTHDC